MLIERRFDLQKHNLSQIFNSIKDLSDIEMQKLTRSGKHSNHVSSFTENLASLVISVSPQM